MAQEVILNVRANTKEAEASLKGVNSEIKNTQQVSGELTGSLNAMTGGAITKFNAFKGTLKGVTGGFKSLRVAIISTGIGALIVAVGSLTAAFTSSEEGQNKFQKILGVIGSITGNLVDLLADLGENIINVFENPKQAIEDFKNLIVENITNRFEGMLQLIPQLGKAIKLLFSGEFTEAGKVAANAYAKVVLGVEDFTDKVASATESIKGFAKEIEDDANAAAKIADQRAAIDKRSRQLLVDRAQAERDIAALREKAADKENFTAAERIKFLEEAGQISEDLANKEIAIAKLRFEAKQVENSLSKSTKEDLDEQAQLEADVIAKQTARLRLQKALTAELTTARREEQAAIKAQDDITKKANEEAQKAEAEKLAAIQKIRDDFKLKQEDKEAETALQKAELEEQRKLAELQTLTSELEQKKLAELDAINASEEEKQAVRDYYAAQEKEVRDYYAGVKLDAEAKDAEASKLITQKEQEAKITALQGYASAVSALSGFLGKETGAGKALAVAATLINTYAAIAGQLKAFAGVPVPGYAIAQAVATGASGFAAVRDILKVKVPAGSVATPSISGSSSGGGGASITAAAQAPQFNVIGGGAQNQLAGLLADQTQKPVKAYVVSNEVTTAQSLDRNIVESATLG